MSLERGDVQDGAVWRSGILGDCMTRESKAAVQTRCKNGDDAE